MSYSMSLRMQQKAKPSMKQTQRMIMSPQMQQAIHLLQMPVQELQVAIEAEMEQNPLLEYEQNDGEEEKDGNEIDSGSDKEGEDDINDDNDSDKELSFEDSNFEILHSLDDKFRECYYESDSVLYRYDSEEEKKRAFMENSISADWGLFDHLMLQAREQFHDDGELQITEAIIGNLDSGGTLRLTTEEIALSLDVDTEVVDAILKRVQTFHPYGVAARSLQETILVQLECQSQKESSAYTIVKEHWNDLLHNRIKKIAKMLEKTPQEIEAIIKKLFIKVDFHPGSSFSRYKPIPLMADIVIRQEGDELIATIIDDYTPTLRLNSRYVHMLYDHGIGEDVRQFIRHKIVSAKWLIRNIYQRNQTLEKIADSLMKRQARFFSQPDGTLTPMTMKQVADEVGVHESTIARAVANKYLHSPRGIMSLRAFFTNAFTTNNGDDISSQTVRDLLVEILEKEDKNKPHSDQRISELLADEGVPCARRTVAKYRYELGFGNRQQRKKFYC